MKMNPSPKALLFKSGDLIIDGYDCREGGDINWSQDVHAQVIAEACDNGNFGAIASSEVMNQT